MVGGGKRGGTGAERTVFLLNGAGRGVALKLRGLFSC